MTAIGSSARTTIGMIAVVLINPSHPWAGSQPAYTDIRITSTGVATNTGIATPSVLTPDEIERMQTPLWEQAKLAIDAGDGDGAKALIDRAVVQWSGLKDYSINWITSLLTFVADEMGEEAVERALRRTGEEFVRPRRDTDPKWEIGRAHV